MVVATWSNIGKASFSNGKKIYIDQVKNGMVSILLTNINCEMKSMAVYSALFAMVIHSTAGTNESSFSTNIWEFEDQLNAANIGSHDI